MTTNPSSSAVTVTADSSGLVSLVNPQDSNHQRAVRVIEGLERLHGSILIPSDVFTETINVLGKKLGHTVALAVAQRLLTDATFILAESDAELREVAMEDFRAQPASVSFTDCLVMAYADRYETLDIFGFDEVFARNGYHLPKPLPKAAV